MFRNLLRARMPIRGTGRCWDCRDLSHISVHSAFPATLYRFQIHRESKLFDKKLDQDDWEWEDGVEISDDGLVYPKINLDGMLFCLHLCCHLLLKTISVSNGALFMPNTHFMQKVTRRSFDNYLDAVDNGQPTANPHYLCISKGKNPPDP
jgi:hypothetical protein